MSGVHRLLTRRDKRNSTSNDVKNLEVDHGDLGPVFVPPTRKTRNDKDEDKKVRAILARLQRYGITTISEANVSYALGVTRAEEDAFQLCVMLQDTYEGLVSPYNAQTKLLGAVNRDGVTCYLDALLFAMFARLDSFEAMLYNSFQDPVRKRLAGLLRLWVNMLRSGRLITTDITMNLQTSLAQCGWSGAVNLQQQDTSEAFSFITDKLQLPLLTLKMDMFHTGKDEPDSDHKFVNERLLEVAILAEPVEGESVITLEDCLENYFNNRVDVRRHLDQQRRSSLSSSLASPEKTASVHVESIDDHAFESSLKSPLDSIRSQSSRKRADSIFSQRRRQLRDSEKMIDDYGSPDGSKQKHSLKPEVLMPAFQFFKLLPWYTDNIPTSDAQVAAHFARKRPVLGICLKRYTVSAEGVAKRLDTYVDIPLEIALPDFLSDDNIEEDSPLVGNFKLVLQSLVCHRGTSVHSGHYVSLVRGDASDGDGESRPGSSSSTDAEDPWMLFDDLAQERVSVVDIHETIRRECPYLLFYQVQPIITPTLQGNPPSYAEAMSREVSQVEPLPEKRALPDYANSDSNRLDIPSSRTSIETGLVLNDTQARTTLNNEKRSSTVYETSRTRTSDVGNGDYNPLSAQTTPLDDGRSEYISSGRPSRRSFGLPSRSRQSSQGPETSSRFTLNMSKLASKIKGEATSPVVADAPSAQDSTTATADGVQDMEASLTTSASLGPPSRPGSRQLRRSMDQSRRTGKTAAPNDADNKEHLTKKRKHIKAPERDCTVM